MTLPRLQHCMRCDSNMTYGSFCADCVIYVDIHYGDDA